MTSDHSSPSKPEAVVQAGSRKKARHRIRWLSAILLTAFLAARFDAFQRMFWPSELEHEIRLDLVSSDHIDKDARVSLLNELKLFPFYSKFGPQRFATLCIQKADDTLHLAFARCWRDGMLWRTDANRWKPISDWPTTEEIKSFENDHADLVSRAMNSGYRPRPPGTEDFELCHLSIQVSKGGDISKFTPNAGVDGRVFADVLKHAMILGSFTYAKFHEPRWHAPKDGIAAIERSITHLQQFSSQQMECETLLKELQNVKERMVRIDELGMTFYFLATDDSGE